MIERLSFDHGPGDLVTKGSHRPIIESAIAKLNPHCQCDRLFGDVAATLVTGEGNEFHGVCIDTGSGTGFCAEAAAIGAMVTAGEYKINRIVAVWRDPETEQVAVLPPCGRCREFIRQIDPANIETEVVLGWDEAIRLADLLPFHDWPQALG